MGVGDGQTAINLSTVHPSMSLRKSAVYSQKGVDFLDVPVFSSRPEAESGGLWIVIGGEWEVYQKAEPVLGALSVSRHYIGETGREGWFVPQTCPCCPNLRIFLGISLMSSAPLRKQTLDSVEDL